MEMKEIVLETILDTLKILPFLFIAFLLMEYLEHKLNKKIENKITKACKFGPVIGSVLGAIPQCGFSVAATNLYAGRVVTLGTLIAIYLSTSDEMIPLLLSNGTKISFILLVVALKIIIGMLVGLIIDLFNKNKKISINTLCEEEHCDCDHGILKSTIHHTLNIILFILITTFVLNILVETIGVDRISSILMQNNVFGPFIASIIGLIPNCAASVVITELYMANSITFGSLLAGLLTGSGVALLVLFKVNKNLKENIKIMSTIYIIGALIGVIFDFINVI